MFQLHGLIEKQTRLSCHPHIVLHFVNRTSQQWLRSILSKETTEARSALARWQESTIASVESIMSTCAGAVQLTVSPFENISLQPQPYLDKWQQEDRFDGGAENCARDSSKRRPRAIVVPPYIDKHVLRAGGAEDIQIFAEAKQKIKVRQLPLTGSIMSSRPHYCLPDDAHELCECRVCASRRVARATRSGGDLEDLRGVCALSGRLHEHQNTRFKYAPQGIWCKPQHCRFNFTHVVTLGVRKGNGKIVDQVFARTGKDPVLPVRPRDHTPELEGEIKLSATPFPGRNTLGSRVDTSTDGAQPGRVKTVQFNPREGQQA